MRKYLILCGLAVLALLCALSVHSQAPALDDLGAALVNHGQDATSAGPTAAIIEVALANNNALISRLVADENNITALLAQGSNQANTIQAVQGAEVTDAGNIATLQTQVATPKFPMQVAYQAFRSQTAAIAQSTILTVPATATYNVILAANCTVTGTGAIAVHVLGTSSLGQPWSETISPVCANAGVNQNQTFSASSGSAITLSTAVSGTPTYDVAISVVQLGAN